MKRYKKSKKAYTQEQLKAEIEKSKLSLAQNQEVLDTFIKEPPSKLDSFILMAGGHSSKEEYKNFLLNEIKYFEDKINDLRRSYNG